MINQTTIAALEALLFVSGAPLSPSRISEILDWPLDEIVVTIKHLKNNLEENNRGIRLIEVAEGWQLVTAEEYSEIIERLGETVQPKVTPGMMESLAIISYRQPVTRQEIEQIRGVNSDRAVKALYELELVEERGRKEVVGRPILYGTTSKFLQLFGLKEIELLPRWEEFQEEEQEKNEGTITENNT